MSGTTGGVFASTDTAALTDAGSGGALVAPSPSPSPSDGTAAAAASLDDIVGVIFYLLQEGRGIGIAAKVSAYALQEDEEEEEGAAAAAVESEAGKQQVLGDSSAAAATTARRRGLDTVDANRALGLPDDVREYGAVRDILADLQLLPPPPPPLPPQDDLPLTFPPRRRLHLLTNNPRKVEQLTALGVHVAAREPCFALPSSPLAARYLRAKAERMGHDIPRRAFVFDAAAAATAGAALAAAAATGEQYA